LQERNPPHRESALAANHLHSHDLGPISGCQ
jgi:hypothetical protein